MAQMMRLASFGPAGRRFMGAGGRSNKKEKKYK